jgi:hypothetical protein
MRGLDRARELKQALPVIHFIPDRIWLCEDVHASRKLPGDIGRDLRRLIGAGM